MSKIYVLEKRWKIYRAKKIISSLLIFFLLYAIGGGLYYIYLKKDNIYSFFSKKNEPINAIVVKNRPTLVEKKDENITTAITLKKEIETPKIELKEELFFRPIIPIIDMDRERRNTQKRARRAMPHRVKKESHIVKKEEPLKNIARRENYLERDTTMLKNINISSNSKNYIETMRKKFYKSKNARDALLLAKAFYRKKRYRNSEKWALEANKLDSSLDESWIVFAKSKAKNGKKPEAIKLLAMYYEKSKSTEVRVAIDKIKNGRL